MASVFDPALLASDLTAAIQTQAKSGWGLISTFVTN